MKGSIRWRLFSFAATTILVALVAAGGALVLIFENHLLRRVAHDLDIRWTELARSFALDPDGNPVVSRELAGPRYLRPYGGAYWQIEENGKPVLRSRSLWDFELKTATVRPAERAGAFEMEGPNDFGTLRDRARGDAPEWKRSAPLRAAGRAGPRRDRTIG